MGNEKWKDYHNIKDLEAKAFVRKKFNNIRKKSV